MFRSFFLSKFWFRWSWPGMGVIVLGTWYQVQVDVKINEWFGGFYDLIQKLLAHQIVFSCQNSIRSF